MQADFLVRETTGEEPKVISCHCTNSNQLLLGDARAEEYGPASRSWYAPGGGAQQQANARWEHSNEANGIGWNQGLCYGLSWKVCLNQPF